MFFDPAVNLLLIACIYTDEVIAPSVAKKKKRNSIEIEKLINAKSSHDWINKKVRLHLLRCTQISLLLDLLCLVF